MKHKKELVVGEAVIEVPMFATSSQLVDFVKVIYGMAGSYIKAADAVGVTPATIYNIVTGRQVESAVVREALGIRKSQRTRICADVPASVRDSFRENSPISLSALVRLIADGHTSMTDDGSALIVHLDKSDVD